VLSARPIACSRQMAAVRAPATVHVGATAFLGVLVQPASRLTDTVGAVVAQVVSGGGAAKAGIQAGDTITRIGTKRVSSTATIVAALQIKHPGDKVAVTWTDRYGESTTA